MQPIRKILQERNIKLDTVDPVTREGFTQVPNFILRNAVLSVGAKLTYAMFLSYAWHNDSCFPGQDRLADDMGLSRPRVTQFVSELSKAGLVTIQRRGLGKTNIYTIHFQVNGPRNPQHTPHNPQMLAGQHPEVKPPTYSRKQANFIL